MYQFKVGFIYYPNLKQNREFKEKVERCLYLQFFTKTSAKKRKTMKHYNTCVIDILMFYDNTRFLIIKVLGVVVY